MTSEPGRHIDRLASPTTRRDFLKVGGATMATVSLFGLSACGSGGTGASSKTISLGLSPDLPPFMKGPIAQYAAKNGIKVNLQIFPSDTDQYFDRVRTQLQAGSADVDVFAGDVSWPAQFAVNGWLADLSSRFTAAERAAFLSATVASNEYRGKLYGVPFFTDVGLMYYRKDLLERTGYSEPPRTWDEFKEVTAKVMRDQKVKNGFVFTGDNYEGGTLLGTEFIKTSGGNVINGADVTIDSAQAIAGLALERSMVTSGISPAAVANFQEEQTAGLFLGGNAVFMRNWAYVFGLLPNKSESKISPSQVGVTAIPVANPSIPRVNVGGGWNLYVNAASEKQDEAWKLVQFISGLAEQKHLALAGDYLPTRTALYSDPQLIKGFPAVAQAKTEISQTVTPPISPYYHDLSAALAEQFNACLRGASSPEQTAAALQAKLQEVVKRGGAA